MILSNDNAFFSYLSLYSTMPHWKLMFPYDNENNKLYEIPVGAIVYFILNRVKMIKDDGQIDYSKYASIMDIEIDHKPYDREKWLRFYYDLIYLIDQKTEMPKPEKYRRYRIYNQFAFFLLNNYDFDEWISFAEDCETSGEITNPNYNLSDVIEWRGYRNTEDGTPYSSFWVKGFEYLFILDLWELLYNPNVEIKIKKCKYCDLFFFTNTNQRKYCCDCSESKQYNKIRNEEQKKDEAKRLCKLISDILYKRDPRGAEYQSFLNENQYYKNRLKGKNVESNPNYKDISTEDEYKQWLTEYHEKIKVRKGHIYGKTNETCKRNGERLRKYQADGESHIK